MQSQRGTEIYPTHKIGKPRGSKPTEALCGLDTGASVNLIPLTPYQLVNSSEFQEQDTPIGGYSQATTILKGNNGNPIQ